MIVKRDSHNGYDIIGDIHGHADELIQLLDRLGYNLEEDVYTHPSRQAIFLGDFIDKGPKQKEVLKVVMPMVKQGSALAVMGNHEFNALAFHTPHPHQPGQWLRERKDNNIKQHIAFLQEFLGKEDPADPYSLPNVLAFFKTLPIWLETDHLRIVHACWSEEYIAKLTPLLAEDRTLDDAFLLEATTKETLPYEGIETLLKGVEYTLSEDLAIIDNYGKERTEVRIKWWLNQGDTVEHVALSIGGSGLSENVKNHHVPTEAFPGYAENQKPLFIGHYWLTVPPKRLAHNVACLDYSVANNGHLVAYRWDGEQQLTDAKFVSASC